MNLTQEKKSRKLRLAVLQRVCPKYRVALFRQLSEDKEIEAKLFIGADIPQSKVRSATQLESIRHKKLNTVFIKFGRRILPWHTNLIGSLARFKPDVILCEGESHFLGYIQAILYRFFYNRKVALIHWCFISLPGESLEKSGVANKIKKHFRQYFDAFLLYSSFSKNSLIKLGVSADKMFVATNVSNVQKFLDLSDALKKSTSEARDLLHLPQRFSVLYVGTLDKNKKPEMILDLAKSLNKGKFNFLILGSGPLSEELKVRAQKEDICNLYIPGRVEDLLPIYYRASDVLVIPGRGGIIISEAMAFGLPVIVHEADGTEYDLVCNMETGIHLQNGGFHDFKKAIEYLSKHPDLCKKMSKKSRDIVENHFNTSNMVKEIIEASKFAKTTKQFN